MNQEALYNVLLAPRITEKGSLRDQQYVFKVIKTADKKRVKAAVELFFNVKVKSVNTVTVKGKPARFGRTTGRRQTWKKAYVTLMPGEQIELAGVSA